MSESPSDALNRYEFERRWPIPTGVHWSGQMGRYFNHSKAATQRAIAQNARFDGWKSAREQPDTRFIKYEETPTRLAKSTLTTAAILGQD